MGKVWKRRVKWKNNLLYGLGTEKCRLRAYNGIVKREGFPPKSIIVLSCQGQHETEFRSLHIP